MQLMIRHLGDEDVQTVLAAAHLFDGPPRPDATRRFLAADGHHLLIAYDDERPVGFASGIEIAHPDKDLELCLYEVGVDEPFRRRGIGNALVAEMRALAAGLGCSCMWLLVDDDNDVARALYARAGGRTASQPHMVEWRLGPAGPSDAAG
jgi:ribosomal protein S18 acetylase RimI-like enzyme